MCIRSGRSCKKCSSLDIQNETELPNYYGIVNLWDICDNSAALADAARGGQVDYRCATGSLRQQAIAGYFQPGAGYFGKEKDEQAKCPSQKPNNKQMKNATCISEQRPPGDVGTLRHIFCKSYESCSQLH